MVKKTIFMLCLSPILFAACNKPQTDTHKSNTAPNQPMAQITTAPQSTSASASGNTAATSLDWAGKYKGVFPCADCQGIETELELKADKTYALTQVFLGRGKDNTFKVKGTFSFDANHPSIISLDQAGEHRKFFVGENFVEARDMTSGKVIDSQPNYKLQKELK